MNREQGTVTRATAYRLGVIVLLVAVVRLPLARAADPSPAAVALRSHVAHSISYYSVWGEGRHWFAVGASPLAMESTDAGKTWQPLRSLARWRRW